MKVPDRLRVVGAETEVEVGAGGEDEEELRPAGVELAEGVIPVQQLGGEVLQEPVRHRRHQAVGGHTLVHGTCIRASTKVLEDLAITESQKCLLALSHLRHYAKHNK